MIDVTVRFLGGLRRSNGPAEINLTLPDGADVVELERRLRALNVDLDSGETIVTLNQRGLGQWPSDQRLAMGDAVVVFPNIAGG